MKKGRTKNKRARKPDIIHWPKRWPPGLPTAYLNLPGGKHGFAEGALTAHYDPLTPVTNFRVTVMPAGHIRYALAWDRATGWTGEVAPELLSHVVLAIEKCFTPSVFRFEPIQI